MTENALYYGDNLDVLRENIEDETVDLVYLDPPFNSQATYNVLFRAPNGEQSAAQIEAFEDTWHWNEHAEDAFDQVMHGDNAEAAEMLRAMRSFLGENDMMAYLTMMAIRLLEMHRKLKKTGSLYLHCDPKASHYLKILLDAVFGARDFRNEIIWCYRKWSTKGGQFSRNHDVILFYSKGAESIFNPQFVPVSAGTMRRWGGKKQQAYFKDGVRKAASTEEEAMSPCPDWWDISILNPNSKERLSYPTQKPLALLDRIIRASSNEGDVVLDPFCGCGTAVHAAQKLRRRWIGIDITHLAISLIEKRLNDAFPGIKYEVHGAPKDLDGARDLANRDKYQFQWWAVSLVRAVPFGGKKKGADTGIDGVIYFKPDGKTTEKAIVSVKGGANVNVGMIRELGHVVDRDGAKMGVFITLAPPTGPMKKEAIKASFYETEYGKFAKIQILTIEELLAGKKIEMPWLDPTAFKKATKEDPSVQHKLI